MTVGVEQASDEDSVAVQGLGDLSDGTYKDICKELREQKRKRNAWQLPRKLIDRGQKKHICKQQCQRKKA